jgi:hypothetical protein
MPDWWTSRLTGMAAITTAAKHSTQSSSTVSHRSGAFNRPAGMACRFRIRADPAESTTKLEAYWIEAGWALVDDVRGHPWLRAGRSGDLVTGQRMALRCGRSDKFVAFRTVAGT